LGRSCFDFCITLEVLTKRIQFGIALRAVPFVLAKR